MSALAPAIKLQSQKAVQPDYWLEDGGLKVNIVLPEPFTSARLHFERALSDDEIIRLSASNELLRFEQEPNGDITVMSPVGTEGSGHESDVAADLIAWARSDGRGRGYTSNGGFRLPDGAMRAADAAWVSWQKLNAVPADKRKGFYTVCPEFVIEVRSDSDRLVPLQAKMRDWLANGSELAWLIDPARKVVEIYRPGSEPEVLEGGSAVEGEGPVAGFVLELGRIWG